MSDLNPGQERALEAARAWYQSTQEDRFGANPFRLFGYAGTGKTFTAARIAETLNISNVVFGTYTGKAASVLRRSLEGYSMDSVADFQLRAPKRVSTIHSAIYYPTSDSEAREKLADARRKLRELEAIRDGVNESGDSTILQMHGWDDWNAVNDACHDLEKQIPQLEAATRRMRWELNPDSEWSRADLIVLDEVSMVNAKLAGDIESYDVPIMVLGDPAQLPPVEGGGYYTDATPNVMLTDIVRQAADNPIVELATRIRESRTPKLGLEQKDMVPASLAAAMEADVVLVWSNKRRWALIHAIRKKMGFPAGTVVRGDTIMCLTNNKDLAVFNGEIFTVESATPGALGPTLIVRTESGALRMIPVFADGFSGQAGQEQAKKSGAGLRGNRMLATFAQAITVHKSQGSEWDHVYVVNETPAMISMGARRQGAVEAIAQARAWLYTATTRAKEKITVTLPPS